MPSAGSHMKAGRGFFRRRVVIPATVQMVENCAFEWCGKLTDLVIEGDLSRVARWHEDAFTNCPCEAEYLELRRELEGS